MTPFTLYYWPVTCSRVSLVALEEIGAPYRLQLVDLTRGEHLNPAYLAINPKGKVPALQADETILTETPAILTWLARTHPPSRLLPLGAGAFEDAVVQSDLTYVSAGLHPIITRMCRSYTFCDVPGGAESVYAFAADAMRTNLQLVEDRLAEGTWWYGENWSAMDAYIGWVRYRVASTPFDLGAFPNLARHSQDLAARPSVQRAEQRGEEAAAEIARR